MEDGQPVGVILNPRADAGRALRLLPDLSDALAATGRRFQLYLTSKPGDATDAASRFARAGIPLVLSVGGDGTINEIANGLRGHDDVRLGIVPAGRGADFVRSIGPSHRSLIDLAGLCQATPRRIDLGLAGFADGTSRAFVNVAGVGFDAEVAERSARSRLPGRTFPYLAGAAGALIRHRCQEMSVDADGSRFAGPMRSVLVANGQFFAGGLHVVPTAAIDDGALDVALVGDISPLDLLRTMPSIYRGTHTSHPKFQHRQARTIRVESAAPARVELDGEVAGYAPVTFSVLPGALLVVT